MGKRVNPYAFGGIAIAILVSLFSSCTKKDVPLAPPENCDSLNLGRIIFNSYRDSTHYFATIDGVLVGSGVAFKEFSKTVEAEQTYVCGITIVKPYFPGYSQTFEDSIFVPRCANVYYGK